MTIAIADSLSDALGIHIVQESENKHGVREIWESTISTFLSKFILALTFVLFPLLLPLSTAIIASVVWGLFMLAVLSFYLAKKQKIEPRKVVLEHLFIALLVITITQYVGGWIGLIFS